MLERFRQHVALDRALAQVFHIHRDVLALWLEGYDNLEIAAELGVNYNTVRSRLRRGRLELERYLQTCSG